MKRTYTLIVLFGLVIGTMLTGCNSSTDDATTTTTEPSTNAPAATQ